MSIDAISSYSSDAWSAVMQSMREQQQERSGASMFEDMADQIVSDKDTDGDGLLSVEEMNLSDEEYAELDTDGDGQVSTGEIAAGLSTRTESLRDLVNPAAQFAQQILANFDADGDGSLSLDESSLDEDVFSELDSDGDGLLSTEEIAAGIPEPPAQEDQAIGGSTGVGGSSGSDDDEEEEVSLTSAAASGYIDEMDTDEDGVVSQAELLAWMSKHEQTLADVLDSSEDEDVSTTESLTESLVNRALQAYQDQIDEVLDNLYSSGAGAQTMAETGSYAETLNLSI